MIVTVPIIVTDDDDVKCNVDADAVISVAARTAGVAIVKTSDGAYAPANDGGPTNSDEPVPARGAKVHDTEPEAPDEDGDALNANVNEVEPLITNVTVGWATLIGG